MSRLRRPPAEIADLRQRRDELSRQLAVLQKERDLETRAADKLAQDATLEERKARLKEVESELEPIELVEKADELERKQAWGAAITVWERLAREFPDDFEPTAALIRLRERERLDLRLGDVTAGVMRRRQELGELWPGVRASLEEMRTSGRGEGAILLLLDDLLGNQIDVERFIHDWRLLNGLTGTATLELPPASGFGAIGKRKLDAGRYWRKIAAATILGTLVACSLWVTYDAFLNWTTYYLRLDARPGVSDIVEVYRGKPGSRDFLGLGGFVAETGIDRSAIEPQHSLDMWMLPGFKAAEVEALSFLRLESQIEVLWRSGRARESLALAEKRLTASSNEVIGQVAAELAQFGSLESVELLSWRLVATKDDDSRKEIVRALGKSKLIQAEVHLEEVLFAASPELRESIANSLEHLDFRRSTQPLIALLADQSSDVRSSAVAALVSLNQPEAVGALVERLNDPDSKVRNEVALGLGYLRRPEVLDPLVERLADPDPEMRQNVAYALAVLGSPEAAVPLITKLVGSDAGLREGPTWVLDFLGNNLEAVGPLVSRLASLDSAVRAKAADALGSLGSWEALVPLIGRLADPASEVRKHAAGALGSLKCPDAVSPLIANLASPDSVVRASAASALGDLGSSAAVEPLMQLLINSDAEVRRTAAEALGSLGSLVAVEPLVERLTDPDEGVRFSAAEALALLGGQEAIAPLIERLDDPASSWRAAEGLAYLGNPLVLGPLTERLTGQQNLEVSKKAARVLSALGRPAAIIEDFEHWNREHWEAEAEVSSLIGIKAIGPLLQAAADPKHNVRNSAAVKLGPPAIAVMRTIHPRLQEAVILALGALETGLAHEAIVRVYLEEEFRPRLRLAAAASLLALGDDRGLAELQSAAASELVPIRIRVAGNLGDVRARTGLPLLEQLVNDPHRKVREAAIVALGQVGSPTSVPLLKEIAARSNLVPVSYAQKAVEALGKIGTLEAIEALQAAAMANEASLGALAYRSLGDLGARQALPQLRERLDQLEDAQRTWRQLRDFPTGGMAATEQQAHLQQLVANRPDPAWSWIVAHTIARIDQEEGIRLLAHDLAKAREGAAAGLAQIGGASLVGRLDEARAAGAYPFDVAAFQAIDQALRRIERTGGPEEREALIELIHKVKDREAVCTRIEYTIQLLDRENPIDPKLRVCDPLLPKDLQLAPPP